MTYGYKNRFIKPELPFNLCEYIDAATRSRYAKAAHYLGVVVDIYDFLGKVDEGDAYVALLMIQNSRRPALKDEIKKKTKKLIKLNNELNNPANVEFAGLYSVMNTYRC